MSKKFIVFGILAYIFLLNGCSDEWNDLVDTVSGSGDDNPAPVKEEVAVVASEAPTHQQTPGEKATEAKATEEVAAALTNQANPSALRSDTKANATKTDQGRYHGRHNGNRPTWYFPRNMSSYPSNFKVSIPGCSSFEVRNNNGRRYEYGGYIVKQSDVPGRGLALVAPAQCNSKSATITFVPK